MRTTLKAALASLLVAGLSRGTYVVLGRAHLLSGVANSILIVSVGVGLGAAGYVVGARLLHIEEVETLWGVVRRRLGSARPS